MEQEIFINQYKDAFLAKYFFVTYKEQKLQVLTQKKLKVGALA